MMLRALELTNFKCFAKQRVELGAITLLTGLNGMGKSTVLQSLLLLRQSDVLSQYLVDESVKGLARNSGPRAVPSGTTPALILNGRYLSCGTARDVLHEGAEEDKVRIRLEWEGGDSADLGFAMNDHDRDTVDGTSAQERLVALAEVLKALRLLGAARVLRSTRDALDRLVSPHESMRAALYADHGHREARQLLRSALNKAPFVDTLQERAEHATGRLIDVRHGERPAPGLGMALLLRSTAVSLVGVTEFAVTDVPVSSSVLVDTGEIQTTAEHVLNVWDSSSVERSRQPITERVIGTVTSGEQAWGRRSDLFSHLEWSREAQAQLRSLAGSELVFHSVVERLVKLNQYTATWAGGPFEPPVKFSSEAGGTLQHGRLGAERECTLPSGETKRLSLHIKLTDYWRIYFEFRQLVRGSAEEPPRGRALVGYIGKHLRL